MYNKAMQRRHFRLIAATLVLVGTIVAGIWYYRAHPAVGHQLAQTPPWTLVLLVGIYVIFTGVLGLILHASLLLCKTKLPVREGMLVTGYSAIVNFFGPLQSGPAFRALYLKKKHGVLLKDYTLVTLLYYAFYGAYSVLLLFATTLGWWLLVLLAIGGLGLMVAARSSHPLIKRFKHLRLRDAGWLGLATALQVLLLVIIFYIEIHATGSHASLGQILVYTGAANLALFASITPGAIGFRESFLYFTQNLHHIPTTTIVAANLIDRSVYILMLGVVSLLIFGSHAERQLKAGIKES